MYKLTAIGRTKNNKKLLCSMMVSKEIIDDELDIYLPILTKELLKSLKSKNAEMTKLTLTETEILSWTDEHTGEFHYHELYFGSIELI